MEKFVRLCSGRLLCVTCARDFAPRAARFHPLHCRAPRMTGAVANGVRAASPDELKTVRKG